MSDDLAQRAVACKHWRWLPGVRILHPNMGPARVLGVTDQGVWVTKEGFASGRRRVGGRRWLPDLSDDLTRLGLLALVREAWKDPLMQIMNAGGGWVGFRPAPIWTDKEGPYETEAEALVAALEAAP